MKKYLLKPHCKKFLEYQIEHGIKVFLIGKYSNIDILTAIKQESYDRKTQNVVFLKEIEDIPIVTDLKAWDDYTNKQLKEIHQVIIKIEEMMKKSPVDLENKYEVLAFIYQYFQFHIKYYDMIEKAKFKRYDDIYLLEKNDNLYSALVEGYSSSKGISEAMKVVCNYFDIACDVLMVENPKEEYINKVYFENGEVSYLSLADEIKRYDGYFTFTAHEMIKRNQPLEKKQLSYEYFLMDRNHFYRMFKTLKTSFYKGVDFPFRWKKKLFDKINQATENEKTIEVENEKKYLATLSLQEKQRKLEWKQQQQVKRKKMKQERKMKQRQKYQSLVSSFQQFLEKRRTKRVENKTQKEQVKLLLAQKKKEKQQQKLEQIQLEKERKEQEILIRKKEKQRQKEEKIKRLEEKKRQNEIVSAQKKQKRVEQLERKRQQQEKLQQQKEENQKMKQHQIERKHQQKEEKQMKLQKEKEWKMQKRKEEQIRRQQRKKELREFKRKQQEERKRMELLLLEQQEKIKLEQKEKKEQIQSPKQEQKQTSKGAVTQMTSNILPFEYITKKNSSSSEKSQNVRIIQQDVKKKKRKIRFLRPLFYLAATNIVTNLVVYPRLIQMSMPQEKIYTNSSLEKVKKLVKK